MPTLHLQPDFDTFRALAVKGNLVPVMAELAADYETPLSAFQKIHDGRCAFLLESAELTQHSGRYSLLGSSPRLIFTARGRDIEVEERGKVRRFTCPIRRGCLMYNGSRDPLTVALIRSAETAAVCSA